MKLSLTGSLTLGSRPVRSGNVTSRFTRTLGCAAIGLLCLNSAPQARSSDCLPPPEGLVSLWPGQGNANDVVGTNNGVLVSGVGFAPGKVGQAFSFNGGSSYIRIPDSPSLHFTNAMTIEAWIYPTSLGTFHNIVSKWDSSNQRAYTTALQSDGRLVLGVCNDGLCSQGTGGSSGNVWSTTLPPANQWTHFAATYDGAFLRMYVNGILEGQVPYTLGIFPGGNNLIIGAAIPGLSPFAGLIDEPSVYKRALLPNEIQAIYAAGSAGKCQPPIITTQPLPQVGYWGRNVTFNVRVSGGEPLYYQWLKESTPIAGANNSSLVLTNVQTTNMGYYSVVITNTYGSVTSSNAYLTVNPAGVSLALYSGITIDGVVGQTYGIQANTNLYNTNGWKGVANVTLGSPIQLWIDAQPANQPQRYYRVVPGPITIP